MPYVVNDKCIKCKLMDCVEVCPVDCFYEGKKIEENSNQILDFTKEVKSMSNEKKILIVETLWQIIYSNNDVDIYESNLMRRLGGLLYIDSKIMGNIKEKIKKQNSK